MIPSTWPRVHRVDFNITFADPLFTGGTEKAQGRRMHGVQVIIRYLRVIINRSRRAQKRRTRTVVGETFIEELKLVLACDNSLHQSAAARVLHCIVSCSICTGIWKLLENTEETSLGYLKNVSSKQLSGKL